MQQNESVLETFIEIEPVSTEMFYKIKETLTRMGLVGKKTLNGKKNLWQSCHIFFKRGKYYIVHFKQLFLLDGRTQKTEFTEEDKERVYLVAKLLTEWKLITPKIPIEKKTFNIDIVIIPYQEKSDYNLREKYTIGKKSHEPSLKLRA